MKEVISKRLYYLHNKLFPSFYYAKLLQEINECETILDVGCGSSSPAHLFPNNKVLVGVDGFMPSIEISKEKGIHSQYYHINLLDIEKTFAPRSFDCVMALDVIEHFDKPDALKLISMIEKLAIKKVILFTPNGFLAQKEYDSNEFQIHKSGWSYSDMKHMGYRLYGINGLRCLRGEFANIRYRPTVFWLYISSLSELFTRVCPRTAFQLLGIKRIL
jgi:predicted TPR repeat methyltransferase